MIRVLLAGTAGLVMSSASALAGGLQPPIQPIAPDQSYVAPASCPVVQPVIAALRAQGFTRIEVDTGPTQARFTTMQDRLTNVFVYDCTTGALLGQTAERVSAGLAPGVIGVGDDDNSDFVAVETAGERDAHTNGDDGGVRIGGGDEVVSGADGATGGDEVIGEEIGGNDLVGGDDPGTSGEIGEDVDEEDVGDDSGIGNGNNSKRGGCDRDDFEGTENAPNENCGGGNNTGGVDPDNPGAGGGGGRTGGVDNNGNGPGQGGLGGNSDND